MHIVKFFMIGLSFETCFKSASVSLLIGNDIKTLSETREAKQSETLSKMTESLLKENGIKPVDLNFLLSNKGPGSFTGIRIGLSFMEGMQFFLNIKTFYLTSFASCLAEMPAEVKGEVLVVLKAIRETFYIQLFSQELQPLKKPEYKTLEEVQEIINSCGYKVFGNFEGLEGNVISNSAQVNSENNLNTMLKYDWLITTDKTPFYFREAIGGGST